MATLDCRGPGYVTFKNLASPSMSTRMQLGTGMLLEAEQRYGKEVVGLWRAYVRSADRYSLEGDDLYLAVAAVDLLQQITSELLAVSFVAAVVADSDMAWIDERRNFCGDAVRVPPALRRAEFVGRVGALLTGRGISGVSDVGRDMRFEQAAERVWERASRCACARCYRCPGCLCVDCVCGRGEDHYDLEPESACRGGAVEPELRLCDFEAWQTRTDVAWPAPAFDLVQLMAVVAVCDGLNMNSGTGYLEGERMLYELHMHNSLKVFWEEVPALGIVIPLEMRAYNVLQPHEPCKCPGCPGGRPCERAEYWQDEQGETHPFRLGRCVACAGSRHLCDDRCVVCRKTPGRCGSCEKRRRAKPAGCPSSGEGAQYSGPGCTGVQCRCRGHVECWCIKCVLGSTVAALLVPSRGLRIMAIDRLDPPENVSAAACCLVCACPGGCECSGLATDAALARLSSLVHGLVAEARRAEVLCAEHAGQMPWRAAGAKSAACDGAPGDHCLERKPRKHAWTVMVGGRMRMHKCAAVELCVHCTGRVYGLCKTSKAARTACAACRTGFDALVAVLAEGMLADLERFEAESAPTVAGVEHPPATAEHERYERDRVCWEEYLHYDFLRHTTRLPVTSGGAGLLAYQRADTRAGCRPTLHGVPRRGVYDLLVRGRDERTGQGIAFLGAGGFLMEDGPNVLTVAVARIKGLSKVVLDAAQSAHRRFHVDKRLGTFGSPARSGQARRR